MFPIALEGNNKLRASVNSSGVWFNFACTYIEGEQINTVVEEVYLTTSETILLEAPATGSRIIRQVILFCPSQSNVVTLLLGDSPSVPIARFSLRPRQTLTLGGAYDESGRLNVASSIGDVY